MRIVEPAGRAIWDARAELLAALAGVFGWLFLTSAIAELVAPRIVWRISAGLFCLTLFGWKFLYELGRKGLYALAKGGRR